MSSRVTITYLNKGTAEARPVIRSKRTGEVKQNVVVDDSSNSDRDSVVLPRRKGRPRKRATSAPAALRPQGRQRPHNDHDPKGPPVVIWLRMLKGVLVACAIALSVLTVLVALLFAIFLLRNSAGVYVVLATLSVLMVAFVVWRAIVSGVGWHYIIGGDHRGNTLYEHECKACAGTGAQTLRNDGTWGPIKEENRLWYTGTDHFHAPLANVRTCTNCQGRTKLYLPYPPKKKEPANDV